MFRKSALVLTVAVALLALVRCEVVFPKRTYKGTVAGGGAGAGGTGAGGTGGTSGTSGSAGADCFPMPDQKFCGGSLCPAKTDPAHGCANSSCATCSVSNATAACAADGTCTIGTCNTGFADCDGNAGNGCEINTDQDPKNCGGCGHDCFATNPSTNWVCQGGQCAVSTCPSGKGDCNGNSSDGCETSLASDPKNCAFCGNDCSTAVQHATATCANSKCGYSTCDAGWADCDGNPANGCEQDVATDPNHCGACGNACSATNGLPACVNGSCTIACDTGYGNCDGNAKNGCETNLKTSPNHCGSCSTACSTTNAIPSCVSGSCQLSCQAGFSDCDNNKSNGCEKNTSTDVNNCGTCGYTCGAHVFHTSGVACTAGTCSYTGSCNAGWADCDNNKANGCEADLTNNATCGNCATSCKGGQNCVGGTCQ